MSAELGTAPPRKGVRRLLGRIVVDTRPLKIPAYRRLWSSTAVTAVGSQLTAVAVPKQVFDLTGSSGYVGLTGAVALVPLLVFGLWGGAVADAVDRRKLLLVTNVGVTLTSAMLWLQAFAGVGSVWLVLGLLAVNQAFFAINMPTRGAVVARLVPAGLLPSANALSTTMSTFGAVFGPLLAGALIPIIGLSTLYLIDVAALLITLIAVWRLPPIPPLNGPSRRAGLGDVADGFRYLATQKVLLASFVADIIAMVAGMPRALIPEMAERTLACSPAGRAWSIKPVKERSTMPAAVQMMLPAPSSATSGSSHCNPVSATSASPIKTPAEVYTSVIRCRPSASSTIDSVALPTRNRTWATARLMSDATAASSVPRPRSARRGGASSRSPAYQAMAPPATRMKVPSRPLEKYSIFS